MGMKAVTDSVFVQVALLEEAKGENGSPYKIVWHKEHGLNPGVPTISLLGPASNPSLLPRLNHMQHLMCHPTHRNVLGDIYRDALRYRLTVLDRKLGSRMAEEKGMAVLKPQIYATLDVENGIMLVS